jgi:hippurate hydrolase
MMGTFRAMDEAWRSKAHELIRHQAGSIAEAMGAGIDVKIDLGYPCVFNDEKLHDIAMQAAKGFMGSGNVEETEMRMGAEDFGYYSQVVPGCFFRLGTGNKEKGITSGVHTPTFNIDENAIEKGMAIMAFFGASLQMR